MQVNPVPSSRRTKAILAAMKITHAIFLAVLFVLVLCFAASISRIGQEVVKTIFLDSIRAILCIAAVTVLLRLALAFSKRVDAG